MIDATDLALLTGQRPADVLKLRRTDIRDGAIWIIQNKTGARLGIEITGELAEAITRISARPKRAVSAFLIQDENGQPLIGCVALPDKDDQHVLAAAIAGHADAIVTFNIKHFDLAPEKRTP